MGEVHTPAERGTRTIEKPRQIVLGQHIVESKKDKARELRRKMTPAESVLWERLRGSRLGIKVRRQQIIAWYIADFYCHQAGIAIEVDGDTHEPEYDTRRDLVFAQRNVRTLRFRNEDVLQETERVMQQIKEVIEERESSVSDQGHGEPATAREIVSGWDKAHVMTTYKRFPVQFVRGEGVYLYDNEARPYLDLLAGIAVCSVGHCHPYLVKTLQEQAATLLHTSNLYLTEPQARLARRLMELSDFERVFFCNSGAEANEAAIKIARKCGKISLGDNLTGKTKHRIVTALKSFHGRTLATVTATGQPRYSEDFAPLPEGFSYVPYNDTEALNAAVSDETAAILLEPIQGEGGIHPATPEFLQAARQLADRHQALLIFDEVQTGMGRTGKLWAYQRYGVIPDIMTLAKGLGGGVPIGACLARGKAAETFVPGDHGSTFAGNPLAASAANAVLDIIADEGLTENAMRVGAYLTQRIGQLRERYPALLGGVRGLGMMLGIGLHRPLARKIVLEALGVGLIINATDDFTIRLVPPLTLTEAEAEKAIALLGDAIDRSL